MIDTDFERSMTHKPTHDKIAKLAYILYEQRLRTWWGKHRPEDEQSAAVGDWITAESILLKEHETLREFTQMQRWQ